MEVRRDIIPPLLAIAVSLLLHGALAALDLGIFVPAERPPEQLVSIALVEPEIEAPPTASTAAQKKAVKALPAQEKPKEPRAPTVAEPPPPVTETKKTSKPAAAPNIAEAQAEEEVKIQAEDSQGAEASPEIAEEEPLDLSVSPEDLSRITPENPDPTKSPGEVTIDIRDRDLRYRGFLEAVRSAIDRSWNWREALLAAERPGSVTLRISLTPSGHADATIAESSGSRILDNEALATVRRAQMPYFPNHWTISRLNLFAQFDYTFYGEE